MKSNGVIIQMNANEQFSPWYCLLCCARWFQLFLVCVWNSVVQLYNHLNEISLGVRSGSIVIIIFYYYYSFFWGGGRAFLRNEIKISFVEVAESYTPISRTEPLLGSSSDSYPVTIYVFLGGNRTFPWDPARHNLTPNLLSAQKDVNSDWVQVWVIIKIVHCSCVATQMTCGRLQPRHLVYVCVDCVLWKNYSWQKFAPVILPQREVPSCYIVRLWRDLLPFAIFQMKSFLAYCKSLFVSQKCSLCWFLFNMFNVSFCWRQ